MTTKLTPTTNLSKPSTPAPHQHKIPTMPPVMDRKSSKARADRAWRLRCAGRTWQDIADQLGFKSRQSAIVAVQRLLAKDPPEDATTQRLYTAGGLRIVKAALFEALAEAKAKRDPHAVVAVSRALSDVLDRHAKLMGLHIPVAQEVNLTVQQNTAAVLERAQAELLALEQTRPAIVDAEVVELPA